jgi:hypothetical protein
MNIYTGAKKSCTIRFKKPKEPGKVRGRPRKAPAPEGEKIPPKMVYNVLRAIMTQENAGKLAGYAPGTIKCGEMNDSEGTVQEIRERIQNDPSLGFMAQLKYYATMRDNEDVDPTARNGAAKQLDNIAGYGAPQKVEVNERHTLLAAVRMVHQVTSGLGMTPFQLKAKFRELPAGKAEDAVVLDSQVEQVSNTSELVGVN